MAMPAARNECDIVGVFDRPETAERVREELIRSGFHPNQVHTRRAQERGFWEKIGDMFGASDTGAYDDAERQGRGIVVVEGPDDEAWVNRAGMVMQRYNPLELEDTASRRAGVPGTAAGRSKAETETRIPVAEEQLHVGKRRVIAGGVRVYSRVTERPVEKDVELRDERVRVERRPIDAPAGPEAFREGAVEATETHEEPVVRKEARVTEEVVVRKEAEKRREKIRGTVRQQDVEAERIEGEPPHEEDRPRE